MHENLLQGDFEYVASTDLYKKKWQWLLIELEISTVYTQRSTVGLVKIFYVTSMWALMHSRQAVETWWLALLVWLDEER